MKNNLNFVRYKSGANLAHLCTPQTTYRRNEQVNDDRMIQNAHDRSKSSSSLLFFSFFLIFIVFVSTWSFVCVSFEIYCFVYLMSILCRGFSTLNSINIAIKINQNCIWSAQHLDAVNNNKSALNYIQNRIWCGVSYCTQFKITRSSLISIVRLKTVKTKPRGTKENQKRKHNRRLLIHILI